LALLEREIPEGDFVLGVDEHTAIIFDLDSGEATVAGNGHVTVRVRGGSAIVEAGEVIPTARLLEMAERLARGGVAGVGTGEAGAGGSSPVARAEEARSETVRVSAGEGTPLLQAIRSYEAAFRAAKAAGDGQWMVAAALDLNDELWAWVADPNQSDELDRGRSALRAMIVELGALAAEAMRDPAELFGPFVDLLVASRNLARAERRFADADVVRDQLASLGIELHDSPEGSTWERSAEVGRSGQGGSAGAS
jgi:hypothetical protein